MYALLTVRDSASTQAIYKTPSATCVCGRRNKNRQGKKTGHSSIQATSSDGNQLLHAGDLGIQF